MKLEVLAVGFLQENCYIVSDESGACAVVDPGDEGDRIVAYLEEQGYNCRAILLTHGHFDHIGAVQAVKQATGAPVCIAEGDKDCLACAPDRILFDGDTVAAGDLTFRVIETPGHTPGCVCYLIGDVLLSGDTLFCDSYGRTDLPGGDFNTLRCSMMKLRDLPAEDLIVLPGHGEATTLAHERAHNPAMR